jgi:ProP effector
LILASKAITVSISPFFSVKRCGVDRSQELLMSNLSLQEQLQALAGELPAVETGKTKQAKSPHDKRKDKPQVPHQKAGHKTMTPKKPGWLELAQYGVELLKAHYPNCFHDTAAIVPLKVGIRQELVLQLSGREDITVNDKACMVSSLAWYVNSLAYHNKMKVGATRIDLAGHPAGTVTAEEADYAASRREARLQKRKQKTEANATT